MSSFYKLEVLFILRSAILKRHYDCALSSEELVVYKAIVKDIYGRIDVDDIDDSLIFNTYFEDYFNDWLNNDKGYLPKEEWESIEDLLIFRGLLHYRGQSVSLSKLYNYIYSIYDINKYNIKTEKGRNLFLEKLNGCLGEARVAKVDSTGFISRELVLNNDELELLRLSGDAHKKISLCDKIKITTSSNKDPLVFISGLEPRKIQDFKVDDRNKFVFVTISDLHLGKYLINNLGILDDTLLKDRLTSFVIFKDKLLSDLRDNGINVNGVILVGDTLDAFCGEFNLDDKSSLLFNIDMSKKRLVSVVRDFNVVTGGSLRIGNDNTFVGFIAGNHDNTLGKDLFVKIMEEFGEDVTFLGDGSARIKINDEYIMFNHPNSLDWGLPIEVGFHENRKSLNKDIFHFEEYFELCNRKYEFLTRLGLLHTLGTTPRDIVASLVDLVNEDLEVNNHELYEFYKPFITRGNGDGTVIKRSCFEDAIRIVQDSDDPSIQTLGNRVKNGFDISMFIKYGKENLNIRQMLEERNVCLVGGYLDPVLSIIGHFHTRLEEGKRVVYAKESSENTGDGFIPVVVEEGSTHVDRDNTNKITYSATICSLDIKDGVIDKIELEPAAYVVKKEDSGYTVSRMSDTISSVYVRKKTL